LREIVGMQIPMARDTDDERSTAARGMLFDGDVH
jgi:hypothetical protein